jgi:hypothetical protein
MEIVETPIHKKVPSPHNPSIEAQTKINQYKKASKSNMSESGSSSVSEAPTQTEPSGTSSPSVAPSASPSTASASANVLTKKFQRLEMPTPEKMMQEDVFSNCFIKTVIAGVMGGVSGVALGLFFAALENSHGVGLRDWCTILNAAVHGTV